MAEQPSRNLAKKAMQKKRATRKISIRKLVAVFLFKGLVAQRPFFELSIPNLLHEGVIPSEY